MKEYCFIDFETRSDVDLKKSNAHDYSESPLTETLCMGWVIGFDDPVHIWQEREEFPPEIEECLSSGGTLVVHNLSFEHLINKSAKLFKFNLEQGICTMAAAFSAALPGSLENIAPAMGLEIKKDMVGNRAMLKFALPRSDKKTGQKMRDRDGNLVFWTKEEKPEDWQKMLDYCVQDVEVTREIFKRVPRLSKDEQRLWLLDQEINARGVPVDAPLLKLAHELVVYEKDSLNLEMQLLTMGAVSTCTSHQQTKKWLKSQGLRGVKSIDKAHTEELLKKQKLSDVVRRVLELKKKGSRSSTAKIIKMIEKAGPKGRIRGGLQFHVATTGRWAAWGVQLHNMPKRTCSQDEVDAFFYVLEEHKGNVESLSDKLNLYFGDVNSIVASSLRGFIKAPPGKKFVVCDFKAIEARDVAWLASEEGALEAFRTHGKIYEQQAAGIFNLDSLEEVNSTQRPVGKTAVLAFGYQGGVAAFRKMEASQGLDLGLSDSQVNEIKTKWRLSNPKIVKLWYACEECAIEAIRYPGKAVKVNDKISYVKKGSFLWCQLPSGRTIKYAYPTLKQGATPWGEPKLEIRFMGINAVTRKWERQSTYGGKLVENITQAVARDHLVDAMFKCEVEEYKIIATIHDEIISEVDKDFGSVEEMEQLMSMNPLWAHDLPLAAEGYSAERFRK